VPPDAKAEKELHRAIIEACREVKELFDGEYAGDAPPENTPELAHYRQSLQAGLNRLQGKWKETLGDSNRE
jgi:hypothetical protein